MSAEDSENKGLIRFGLVGCGKIAAKHVAALRGLNKVAKIVGVFDLSLSTAQAFSQQHSVTAYEDIAKMMTANPDVLVILTPSGIHAETLLELTRYNKHFVVEKPLALRLDHVDRALEECDQRGLKIFVVQQNRFNPPVMALKTAISQGRFGRLVLGTVRLRWTRNQNYYDDQKWRGTWALDGGVFANQASHHIDMLVWMMGEVESVFAKTATRLARIEAEDTGVAVIKFKNGALGVIEATTATRPKDLEGSISILGEKGTVEVGGFFMNELKTWSFVEQEPMDVGLWQNHARVPDEPAWSHRRFYEDVITSIRNDRKGIIDGLQGRKTVELISALYESAETGKEVFLRFVPVKCRLGLSNDS